MLSGSLIAALAANQRFQNVFKVAVHMLSHGVTSKDAFDTKHMAGINSGTNCDWICTAKQILTALRLSLLSLLCIFGLMTSRAWGDEHEAHITDAPRTCSEVLDAAPFNDFKNWTENGRYSQIASDHQGSALVGVACDEETITRFMEIAGWEKTVARRNLKEEAFGIQYDEDVHFCLRRSLLGQLIMGKCKGLVVFRLKGGKIRHITAGAII